VKERSLISPHFKRAQYPISRAQPQPDRQHPGLVFRADLAPVDRRRRRERPPERAMTALDAMALLSRDFRVELPFATERKRVAFNRSRCSRMCRRTESATASCPETPEAVLLPRKGRILRPRRFPEHCRTSPGNLPDPEQQPSAFSVRDTLDRRIGIQLPCGSRLTAIAETERGKRGLSPDADQASVSPIRFQSKKLASPRVSRAFLHGSRSTPQRRCTGASAIVSSALSKGTASSPLGHRRHSSTVLRRFSNNRLPPIADLRIHDPLRSARGHLIPFGAEALHQVA
jgi:hypothetical protein